MGKSFKDSLKTLEADIQHANLLCFRALGNPRETDGACLQMKLSYSPAAQFFLFLVQWADCQLAGALGLLRVLIYMTNTDSKNARSVHERKASIKEFYDTIFPSLLQLESGVTDLDDRKQKVVCSFRYSRKDSLDKGKLSVVDVEREDECGICMEMNSKVALPNCCHSLCLKCYQDWRRRSQSCPFCRDNLRQVNSGDLWICVDKKETIDLPVILRENLQRLFIYVEKLPFI